MRPRRTSALTGGLGTGAVTVGRDGARVLAGGWGPASSSGSADDAWGASPGEETRGAYAVGAAAGSGAESSGGRATPRIVRTSSRRATRRRAATFSSSIRSARRAS